MLTPSHTLSHYHKISYISLTLHFVPLQKTVLAWCHQNKRGHVKQKPFLHREHSQTFIIYKSFLKTLTKPNFPVMIPTYGQFIVQNKKLVSTYWAINNLSVRSYAVPLKVNFVHKSFITVLA